MKPCFLAGEKRRLERATRVSVWCVGSTRSRPTRARIGGYTADHTHPTRPAERLNQSAVELDLLLDQAAARTAQPIGQGEQRRLWGAV